jgi:hypothetical protein
MHKLQCRVFFAIVATLGIAASVPDGLAQANQSQKLPPEIFALVPEGAQVTTQSFGVNQINAPVEFVAERKSGLRSQVMTHYHFIFRSYDGNSEMWKMIAPSSREEVETDSKNAAQSMASNTNEMISPPEVTQYPWGKGVTQRRKFYGDGAPDFYSYHCLYWGVAGSTVFQLEVEEIADRADADKWAMKVADTAARTTRTSLSK